MGLDPEDHRRAGTRSEAPQLPEVQDLTVSAGGYGAGEGQTSERPFGHVDPGVLVVWAFGAASFPGRTGPGDCGQVIRRGGGRVRTSW